MDLGRSRWISVDDLIDTLDIAVGIDNLNIRTSLLCWIATSVKTQTRDELGFESSWKALSTRSSIIPYLYGWWWVWDSITYVEIQTCLEHHRAVIGAMELKRLLYAENNGAIL